MAAERILVLGRRGLLGQALLKAAGGEGLGLEGGRQAWDITGSPEGSLKLFKALRPSIIINCVAMSDVELAEKKPEYCFAVNAAGAEKMARAAGELGAHLVHISTDYVFNGRSSRPYVEDDVPDPLSIYGHAKLQGEKLVAAALPRSLIIRVAWLYGFARPSFINRALAMAQSQGQVKVVIDQIGSPSYVEDLAPAILALARQRVGGIFHVANRGQVSRFEVIQAACKLIGMDPGLVQPSRSADWAMLAARPPFSALDITKADAHLPQPLPCWEEALARFLKAKD